MSTGLRKVPYTVFSPLLEVYFFGLRLGSPSGMNLRLQPQKYTSKRVEKTGTDELFSDSSFIFIKILFLCINTKCKTI